MIMNLTQLEWVKSELKWIFYELNKSSGSLVIIWKRIFLLTNVEYAFETAKRLFCLYAMDRGFEYQNM